MNKELEALEKIKEFCKVINQEKLMKEKNVEYCYLKPHIDYLNIIEKALQRLEAIDNANPSEAWECLEEIILYLNANEPTGKYCKNIENLKNRLLKAYEDEEENKRLWNDITTVDKQYTDLMLDYQEQKKVLEIIKEKGVDVGYLKTCKTLEEYNYNCWNDEEDFNKKLTEEEFDLLKRWVK